MSRLEELFVALGRITDDDQSLQWLGGDQWAANYDGQDCKLGTFQECAEAVIRKAALDRSA